MTRFALAAALAGLAFAVPAKASVFNFATVPAGSAATPLTVTSADGQTAKFSSPDDTAAFQVVSNQAVLFPALSPSFLATNPLAFGPSELDVSFGSAQTAVSFAFSVIDLFGPFDGDTLTVVTNTNQTFTFNVSAGKFPAYAGAFANVASATPFTSLAITDAGNPFDIGTVQTPEPVSLALFGMGLAGIAAARRRR